MPYVLVRTDGKYVARDGSPSSYTDKLQEAKVFAMMVHAEQERCVENERIVDVAEILRAN